RRFPSVAPGRMITLALRHPDFIHSVELVLREGAPRTVELHETNPSETWEKVLVAPLRRSGVEWLEDEGRQLIVTFHSLTELKRVDRLRTDFEIGRASCRERVQISVVAES